MSTYIVNDTRGRSPKELMGLGAGRLLARRPPINVTVVGKTDPVTSLGVIDAGVTELGIHFSVDVTQHPSARIVADPEVFGATGTKLQLQYHAGSGWANAWAQLPIEVDIGTPDLVAPPNEGTVRPLTAACFGTKKFRVIGIDGDGTTEILMRGLQVQFIDAGRRAVSCNSAISAGAKAWEDFCAYVDLNALAAAYGYELNEENPAWPWYQQVGDGYVCFDSNKYCLYLESLSRPKATEISLIQSPFNGGHKSLVIDIPEGEEVRAVQTISWPSEWQIEGATSEVTNRAVVTVKFALEAMGSLLQGHAGASRSTFEIATLRMWALGGATAQMRLILSSTPGNPSRLYAQRATTPSGGSGPLIDLGDIDEVLGAGDRVVKIEANVDSGVGVDFDIYHRSASASGLFTPIYSESIAGAYDRFQTSRILEATCVTPAGNVDGAFKLITHEIDYVSGSIIVP